MTEEDAIVAEAFGDLEKSPAPNHQLYENSPLSGSLIEHHSRTNPDALFNQKAPNLAILHEKPEHRVIIFLKAQGLSNKEISERTGMTQPWISQVLRQPWARERLVTELKAAGRDAVQELLKASAEDSVFTLIECRDSATAKASEKIAAANSLLDRFLGKPIQRVETRNENLDITGVEKLDQQISTMEGEIKRLSGNN